MTDVLVLCYHAVSPDWDAPLSVTPERLERQLSLLRRRGYAGATFAQALEEPPAPRTVAVTFDDAYRSVIRLAAPLLREVGWPGSVYVPTAYAGIEAPMAWPGIDQWAGGPHAAELTPMSWEELAELADQGWEVGSHTRSHPHLTKIDDAALDAELRESKGECEERLGRPCTSIAYPYGDVDARVVKAAAATGYRYGAGLPAPLHPVRPLEWPRVGVYHDDADWRFRLKASRLVRAARTAAQRR